MSLSSSFTPVPAAPPSSGWPLRSTFQALEHVTDTEHLVQVYETEPYLVTCVTRFVRDTLRRGGGAIVVATEEHRAAIEEALDNEELSVAAAKRRGKYVDLDARRTLDAVCFDGAADPERFRRIVGARLAELSRRWTHVRAFGEMVPLLWREGRHAAAHALEEQWQAARREHGFALLSGYPVDALADDFARAALARVCCTDARVLPPQRSLPEGFLAGLTAAGAEGTARARSPRGRAKRSEVLPFERIAAGPRRARGRRRLRRAAPDGAGAAGAEAPPRAAAHV